MSRASDLDRIREGLESARETLKKLAGAPSASAVKGDRSPVTEADLAVDAALKACLPRAGEGWLSEETADSPERLRFDRVWVVDPLDGTLEFLAGLPEWCVSIGLVEGGRAVAGGILNPTRDELILGAVGEGVTLNGRSVSVRAGGEVERLDVLASRSEVGRGEWEGLPARFSVRAMGSVAYKLALLAAGATDATWTLSPKHEWDVAGGAALVMAAGGEVWIPGAAEPRFNQSSPWLPGFVASRGDLKGAVEDVVRERWRPDPGGGSGTAGRSDPDGSSGPRPPAGEGA